MFERHLPPLSRIIELHRAWLKSLWIELPASPLQQSLAFRVTRIANDL
jgi:hypothetical protein